MTLGPRDTIFALSTGNPPAAIGIVRISGPAANTALERLSGRIGEPRVASLAPLRDLRTGELLDSALTLRFPGPNSATGEDLVELHLHGGRAVVAGVLAALTGMTGLRAAEPGEFTRRAFEHGRIDLAEAEGLADLLMAETQSQRRAAIALAGGGFSRMIEAWQARILALAAQVEAALDFADEGDVDEALPEAWYAQLDDVAREIGAMLARPPVERLRDGVRVVLAGPPNVGKSSLLNALVGRDAAITSAIAGTTRDLVEAPASLGGAPFLLIDTAGLRDSDDEIERIGVDRAKGSLDAADLILWLGDPDTMPDGARAILIHPKADLGSGTGRGLAVSAKTGEGVADLIATLIERAKDLLPVEGEVAINARHRGALRECEAHLADARFAHDPLIIAEGLRLALRSLDQLTGKAGVEDMLDALFGAFCIGK